MRAVAEEAVARGSAPRGRSPLRVVHRSPEGTPPEAPPKRRRPKPTTARKTEPVRTVAPRPRRGPGQVEDAVIRAARNLERGYERDALRMLRPLRDTHPGAADVRELLGLALYRLGRWAAAAKELEAYVNITGSTEEHPVLMDCARALKRYARVGELWEELRAASPGADVVTEGRIVAAGALADQGRLPEAIHLLERGPTAPRRTGFHHLRLWYALADLQERAGNLPAARSLFRRVSTQDPAFADVAERLAALG